MFALWNRGDEAHNKVVIFKKWMLNEVCLLKTTMYNRAAHNDVSVDALMSQSKRHLPNG